MGIDKSRDENLKTLYPKVRKKDFEPSETAHRLHVLFFYTETY